MEKVQIPFVMGVLANLSGNPAEPLPEVEDRKALEIDVDNFDSRMKAIRPRASFVVPNKLTNEGNLSVPPTLESMQEFSPAAIARKVEPLAKLLQARTQLQNLLTFMDGKSGAEKLIAQVLQDPALLGVPTIDAPMRHFTEYAGLRPSTLANSVADVPAARRCSLTRGVRRCSAICLGTS